MRLVSEVVLSSGSVWVTVYNRAYGNEKEVGEGIRRSGVPRSEIFVRVLRSERVESC